MIMVHGGSMISGEELQVILLSPGEEDLTKSLTRVLTKTALPVSTKSYTTLMVKNSHVLFLL